MTIQTPRPGQQVIISKSDLGTIFEGLTAAGHTLVGPTIREEAIVYEEIKQADELPIGWTDRQEPGHYRLADRGDGRYFSYVVGPHSWKKYLYPARLTLFSTQSNGGGFTVIANREEPQYALIGVRACELAAIEVQDRIFLKETYHDPHYKARREKAFILAVNCLEPGQNCFCGSMGTGPECRAGFDLALTELADEFLLEVGSALGAEMLAGCEWRLAGAFVRDQAKVMLEKAAGSMNRTMATGDLPGLLYDNLDHPRWDDVAGRCLSCMNCTMVCPTCFCVEVEDVSDLAGQNTERVRVWDSCFNPDYSYVHGGTLRPTVRSRYRQWLTHKLASWIDQFGVPGCVGCGRCITWCPVGIDLTEELAAIRGDEAS